MELIKALEIVKTHKGEFNRLRTRAAKFRDNANENEDFSMASAAVKVMDLIERNMYQWEDVANALNQKPLNATSLAQLTSWIEMSQIRDFDQWFASLGGDKLKMSVPKVLKLKRDKLLKVIKTVTPNIASAKESIAEIATQRKSLDNLVPSKREYRDARVASKHAQRIRQLRSFLRSPTPAHYRYKFERGPFNHYVDTSGFDLKTLTQGYHDFRRILSHARGRARKFAVAGGQFGNRVGKVYMKPGQVYRKHVRKVINEVFQPKAPKSTANHVGVELEFLSKSDPIDIGIALKKAGVASKVELKTDGSLRVSQQGHYSHEICILDTEQGFRDTIKTVTKVLKDTGGYVNPTCGFHTHLDMRSRTVEEAYKRLIYSLHILYAMVPIARRYNKYCRRNNLDADFRTADRDRYHAVNVAAYQRHKTLEVRLHSGTLSARKIINWIDIMLHAMKAPLEKAYKTVDGFSKAARLPDYLVDYIKERTELFAKEEIDDDTEHVLRIYREPDESGPRCGCAECNQTRNLTGSNADPHGEWELDAEAGPGYDEDVDYYDDAG